MITLNGRFTLTKKYHSTTMILDIVPLSCHVYEHGIIVFFNVHLEYNVFKNISHGNTLYFRHGTM